MVLTYYAVLGVPPSATGEQMHAAWKAILGVTHPDREDGGDEERYKAATEAYATLKDAGKRKAYTAAMYLKYGRCAKCAGAGVIFKSVTFTRRELVRCTACNGSGLGRGA